MEQLSRAQRVAAIEVELNVEPEDADGWRAVTRDGVELGLLRRTAGGWQLEWKPHEGAPWRDTVSKLQTASPEMGEAWAVHEIATYLAMGEEVEEQGR